MNGTGLKSVLLDSEAEPYGLRLVLYLEGFRYDSIESIALLKERLQNV